VHTLIQKQLGRSTDGKALVDIFLTQLRFFNIKLHTSGNGILVYRKKAFHFLTAFHFVSYTGWFFGFYAIRRSLVAEGALPACFVLQQIASYLW
jgi:hypothetical protein